MIKLLSVCGDGVSHLAKQETLRRVGSGSGHGVVGVSHLAKQETLRREFYNQSDGALISFTPRETRDLEAGIFFSAGIMLMRFHTSRNKRP